MKKEAVSTVEARIVTMAGLKAEANDYCARLNALIHSENSGKVTVEGTKPENKESKEELSRDDLLEKMTQAVNQYTRLARLNCFDHCCKSGDPMLTAIKEFTFDSIKVNTAWVGEKGFSKIPTYSIDETKKLIDLVALESHAIRECGMETIGKNKDWQHMINALNCIMAVKATKAVTCSGTPFTVDDAKKIRDSFAMTTVARGIVEGRTLLDDDSIVGEFRKVVEAMVGSKYIADKPAKGVGTVDKADVNYVWLVYAQKNKKQMGIILSKTNKLIADFMTVCHRIVLNLPGYDVKWEELKK